MNEDIFFYRLDDKQINIFININTGRDTATTDCMCYENSSTGGGCEASSAGTNDSFSDSSSEHEEKNRDGNVSNTLMF